ncbi:MAG: ThiF family adenylyltransferase [Candidatus Acidiferrum sp.]
MRYSVTFFDKEFDLISGHLAANPNVERAAYLLCRPVNTPSEVRLIVREVLPVEDSDVLENSAHHMKIAPRSFIRAMKRADETKSCFVFVHSHPDEYPRHSPQDDDEEAKLFSTAYIRIRTAGVHASLIFRRSGISAGRVWLSNGSFAPVERVRVVGKRFRFIFPDRQDEAIPEFFDRQVRAFGKEVQLLLKRLRVGIVGVGGVGSCVAEQLVRLGVGSLLIADGEKFEASNVNRVYGSRVVDADIAKVKLAERMAADIGLGASVEVIPKPVTFESVLSAFRDCDVIFGCTDDEFGRSLLTRFAVYYGVPVFDMGVKIDSENQSIRSIQGRVTTLMPGTACLNCRGRISSARISAESMRAVNPEGAAALEEEGYIPELEDPAPAVIAFTTAVAASGVSEFLHRLTGFLGDDRESSEVLHRFDETRVRTNRVPPREECFCGDRKFWGRGDVKPFLDTTWRPE